MNSKWRTLHDEELDDINRFVADASRDGQSVHIGTDSLQSGTKTQFVTVVVILNPPHGGRVAYCREIVPRIKSLRERLMKEVYKSVEIAIEMDAKVQGDLTVHIDANTQEKYVSSQHVKELVGLVVGQGFKALVKPDSWCSTTVADHVVRQHGKLPK